MANRFPLVFDASTNKRIEELPSGDNLSLAGSSIVDAINITASGTLVVNSISANSISVDGTTLSAVATSNDYNDLDNLPALFDGDYNNLSNKPVLAPAWDDITGKPVIATKISQLTNDTNFVSNAQVSITTSQVTDLADIATSGSFNDLSDVPNFVTNEQIVGGTLTVEVSNTGNLVGSVFADDSTLMVDHVNNEILANKIKSDIIEADNLAVIGTGNISIQTPEFFLLQTQSFEIRNVNEGTFISDQDRIRFQGTVDFGLATVTGLDLSTFSGNLKGSLFGDDSTLLVDGTNNTISADTAVFNSISSDIVKTGLIDIDATAGIQLQPNGVLNVPNATTITISATSGISLTATDDLTLESTSGVVDFPSGTTVDFTGAIVTGLTGLDIPLKGDFQGSVFGDDSTILVDGINNTIPAANISGSLAVNDLTTSTITANNTISITSPGSVTIGSSNNNSMEIGTTGTGTINIGSGSQIIAIASGSTLDISDLASVNLANSTVLISGNVPTSSVGAVGDVAGTIAVDATAIYYCINPYTDGLDDIWVKQNWSSTGTWP